MDDRLIGKMVMGRRAIAVLVAAGALLVGNTAQADVVTGTPPPDNCPDGTQGGACFGHGTDFCTPRTCTTDAACGEGRLCQEVALCIGQIDCGFGPPDAGPDFIDTVEGECGDGETCSEGTCETLRICVTDPVFADAGGCNCRLAGRRPMAGAVALGLVAGALAFALRRR